VRIWCAERVSRTAILGVETVLKARHNPAQYRDLVVRVAFGPDMDHLLRMQLAPKKRQRSKLEPYTQLIDELRRRGRTYRDITRILVETCDLIVLSSTLVRFMAARSKEIRKPSKVQEDKKACTTVRERIVVNPSPAAPDDDVWKKIEALKQRPAQTIAPAKQFEYDPDQPLRLMRKNRRNKTGQIT
jgi:hypothetical protein